MEPCKVPQPPGWRCIRGEHPHGTPCAAEQLAQGFLSPGESGFMAASREAAMRILNPDSFTSDESCGTCGQSKGWHDDNRPRHDYTAPAGAGGIVTRPPSTGHPPIVRTSLGPFDPVLRQALIDAGVITPEQLREAENKIRAVTDRFIEEATDGQQQGR